MMTPVWLTFESALQLWRRFISCLACAAGVTGAYICAEPSRPTAEQLCTPWQCSGGRKETRKRGESNTLPEFVQGGKIDLRQKRASSVITVYGTVDYRQTLVNPFIAAVWTSWTPSSQLELLQSRIPRAALPLYRCASKLGICVPDNQSSSTWRVSASFFCAVTSRR